MLRMVFEKKGNAIWISHLDLMRVFQRAFKRAGLPLTHTQGFNPRPSVSIALPLSVGISSSCELLDFELTQDGFSNDEIQNRLNDCLIDGVRVLSVYEKGRKLRELSLLNSRIHLEYDNGIPNQALSAIDALFQQDQLLVEKKTKSGIQEQDIIPMIRHLSVAKADEDRILLDVTAFCQNPTLNPMQLVAAIRRYLPQYTPDGTQCHRQEIYDAKETVFR